MADNVESQSGSGGPTFRTDDLGGVPAVHVPGTKIVLGADGVDDGWVGSGNPLPVSAAALPLPTGAATAAAQLPNSHDVTIDNAAGAAAVNIQDGGNSITIDAASLPLPTGAATAANQLPNSHDVTVDNAAGASAVNIQDGGNSITIDAASLPLPTGASTLAEQQAQTTALQLIDDIVHSGDAAVTKYALIGAVLDDTAPATVTENQAQSLRMTSARALHVQAQANSGVDIGDVTVNNAAGASAVNVQDGGNSLTVDGTVAVSSLPASTNTIEVVGDAANDAAITGNPLSVGGRASVAIPAAASADGRNFYAWLDLAGALFMR